MKLRPKTITWLAVFVAVFLTIYFQPYDPTDDAENRTRSGLYFYVDHGTGCQYIKASWFAELTPRYDGSGRHICRRVQ